ncbi:MAG TPA: amidohydrolase [Terriglobia bacterium]|nr:amidohydrolase [Terriglobia bacterium]
MKRTPPHPPRDAKQPLPGGGKARRVDALPRSLALALKGMPSLRIVDTHQHLWDLDLCSYAWIEAQPAPSSLAAGRPGLRRSFRMPDYLEAVAGLGVEKTVHLEADVDEPYMLAETRHALALAADPNNPLSGVVACGRPEHDDFKEYLDQIAGHRALKGIRRVLHTMPDEVGQGRTFKDNVRSLAGYDLSFDICVLARQLPIALRLVEYCPEVNFVLDHCGVPQVKEKILDPWRADIRRLAALPNVCCKVSGIVAYADPERWTPADLRPYVEHVIDCFGWRRVMFGSDWPVCTLSASFRQWVDALSSITDGARPADRAGLFHDNAVRVYRLG